ncbi:MAG: 6,7-dimethyl-8-ribityllumazine synthase [Verrucomicrobiota bacterium]|jgi:6,7-dimethyl-8-ribityllumazine synthase
MLKRVSKSSTKASGSTFAIVASKYNGRYVDAMVRAAQRELKKAGAKVELVRVPGAFEIPTVAAAIASREAQPAGILCFGVIFQGQTSHAQHVGWGVTHALADIQVQHKLPVIHGVFIFEKEEHAKVRCLGRTHNRGTEAAHTTLEMARVMRGL